MRLDPNDSGDYRRIPREDEGDGPWKPCDHCGFPAPLSEFHEMGCKMSLCSLCANILMPHDSDAVRIVEAVCYVGNTLLHAMGALDAGGAE